MPETERQQGMASLGPSIPQDGSNPEVQILWQLLQVREMFDTPERMKGYRALELAEELATKSHNIAWSSEIHRLRAFLIQSEGRPDEAFQLLVKASAEAQSAGNLWSLVMITLNLGVISVNSGDYDGASVYLNQCLDHATQVDMDPGMQAHAHLILAQAQLERGAVREALHHASIAFNEYRKLGSISRMALSASLLVSIKIELQDIEGAKQVLSDINIEEATPVQLVSLLNLRSKLNSLGHKFFEAHEDHERAIALSSEIGNHRLTTNSIQLKCETLLLEKRGEETLALLNGISPEPAKGYDLLSFHELKGKALEQLGRYQEAFEEVKKFAILQKELLSERASNALSRLRAAQEVLQAEREAAHFRERSQFYAKELSQRTSYLVQQNTYVSEVIDHIKLLSMKRPDAGDLLKDIQKKLRQLPAATFDWEEYLRLFDEIHPNAIPILKQQYPELSETEAKICSLALAKLSNIEIGRLLTITERTVENHRHRLRKKLGLTAGTDLTAFLEKTLAEKSAVKTKQ